MNFLSENLSKYLRVYLLRLISISRIRNVNFHLYSNNPTGQIHYKFHTYNSNISEDKKNISFALSNVLFHKGKENEILQKWLNQRDYYIHDLNMNYANSSYHTKNREKNASREVLITNYPIEMKQYALHW